MANGVANGASRVMGEARMSPGTERVINAVYRLLYFPSCRCPEYGDRSLFSLGLSLCALVTVLTLIADMQYHITTRVVSNNITSTALVNALKHAVFATTTSTNVCAVVR